MPVATSSASLRRILALLACTLSGVAWAGPKAEAPVQTDSPAMVFSRVSGSIVLIRAEGPRGLSQGSGVVVGKGVVATNLHVVAGATRVTVSIKGRDLEAKVTALSREAKDLALLSVDTTGVARVSLRRSTELTVGERVFAIGNPRGFEQTMTDGLISGLRKEGAAFVVQTSAAISPGSSGGGLFDHRGRLVGITTKTRTDGQNLNFANPVEWVEELLKGGSPSDAGVTAPAWTVTARPQAVWCELSEAARWGIFSEGLTLLESSPGKGSVLVVSLDTTQPSIQEGSERTGLVLRDLSEKAQVALFRGAREEVVFVTFEETGDVRATLAKVVEERGEPRLVTRSGGCETGTNTA